MRTVLSIVFFLSLSGALSTPASDSMQAFPPAETGMVRYVLELPKQEDESLFKVQLIVGKTVQVDELNSYFFGGTIEKERIKGWGYSCYRVSNIGPMAGTLMAIDPDAPKVARFIRLGGEAYIIRYNSRLPVVVYVPEGVDVRYRLWTTGKKMEPIGMG